MSSFRPSRSDIVACLSLVVSLLAFIWASLGTAPPTPNHDEPPAESTSSQLASAQTEKAPAPTTTGTSLVELSQASAQMIAMASQSVVRVEHAGPTRPADDLEIYFGKLPLETIGSGIVVDANGWVLTNYHVVRGAERIEVRGVNNVTHTASLQGVDALTDLALLRVPELNLPALNWGESRKLTRGQFVWAIGSPHGLDQSVSMGIISSTDRPTLLDSPFQDFLQTDASINPGSSGGPLIDAHGLLIGINTAIAGDSFAGIGFALPAHAARPAVEQLRLGGHVPRGWIGVQLGEVSPRRGAVAGIEAGTGAYIESFASGNAIPAIEADLRIGDICTQFEGLEVKGPLGLIRAIAAHPIDTIATLTVVRAGRQLQVNVTVKARP